MKGVESRVETLHGETTVDRSRRVMGIELRQTREEPDSDISRETADVKITIDNKKSKQVEKVGRVLKSWYVGIG